MDERNGLYTDFLLFYLLVQKSAIIILSCSVVHGGFSGSKIYTILQPNLSLNDTILCV